MVVVLAMTGAKHSQLAWLQYVAQVLASSTQRQTPYKAWSIVHHIVIMVVKTTEPPSNVAGVKAGESDCSGLWNQNRQHQMQQAFKAGERDCSGM